MERIQINTALVDAAAVAKFLGVDRTTVYALVKGVRGWNRIEALPHGIRPRLTTKKATGTTGKKDWYEFDLDQIAAWKERTGFEASTAGRRTTQRTAEVAA